MATERKVFRCRRCNGFLGGLSLRDYLLGSKLMLDMEFHCPKCNLDNVFTLNIAPILKKNGLPYL